MPPSLSRGIITQTINSPKIDVQWPAVNVAKVLEESRATVGRVESELKRIDTGNKRVGSELRRLPSEESQSP